MMPIPEAVLVGLLAGAAAAAVTATPMFLRTRRLLARLRRERDSAVEESGRLTARHRALESESEHLASARLPALLAGAPHGEIPGLRHAELAASTFAAHQQAVLDHVAAAVEREHSRADSARAAFLVMADRIQVMALAQQQGLDVLEQSAEDPVLMAGLMRADHAAAQLARQAQTMKVLCGAWPGRQWPEAVSLLDVVRGAQSRILEYLRVQVQGSREPALEARAVEPLIHAVAELLDNATRYSPPTVAVLVAIRPVHSGAVIEIDDGGLGMTEQALAEAEERIRGSKEAESRGMGANPQLGLAAVGRLARRYGFSVKLDSPSAYGGVRAVVLVPSTLLARASQAPVTPAPPLAPGLRQHPEPAPAADAPVADEPVAYGSTANGLPRRRSRRHRAAPPAAPEPGTAPAPSTRSPEHAAAFMSSLQTGTRVGREESREAMRTGPGDNASERESR